MLQNSLIKISTKINNLLIKKGYLEKVDDMVLVGKTDVIFSDSSQKLLKKFISQRMRQASHTALPLTRTQVNP